MEVFTSAQERFQADEDAVIDLFNHVDLIWKARGV